MPLFHQPFGAGDHSSHILWYLDLGSCQAFKGNHLLASLKPSLNDLPLATGGDASHILHLRGGVPLLLHGVERAEPQPDDTSLLINGLVHSPDDDRVWLRCLQQGFPSTGVLPRRLLQLIVLALGKEHDLRVDVLLPSCDLGLGQRRIACFIGDR